MTGTSFAFLVNDKDSCRIANSLGSAKQNI